MPNAKKDAPGSRGQAYKAAGVDLDAANTLVERLKSVVAATHTKGVVSDVGGFGGLYKPDLAGMEEPILVAGADGVGTKLKLAVAFAKHDGIGKDLVAMSVNDVLVQGALPLFFLDYVATGRLDVDTTMVIVQSVADACKEAGCALLGGETAEMPDMYPEGEYDLAGFCVGLVDNARIVDGAGIRPGDAVIGLASSGLHANGYSLVRKLAAQEGLQADTPFPGTELTAAQVLLEPTSLYARAVRNLLRDFQVKGMAHITGGGFYDNIPRILPDPVAARIRFGSWPVGPVFQWAKKAGGLSWPEMLQIFNCGVGYVVIVDSEDERDVLDRLHALGQDAWTIGAIERMKKGSEQVVVDFDQKAC